MVRTWGGFRLAGENPVLADAVPGAGGRSAWQPEATAAEMVTLTWR
jgi:hypothetical protein